MTDLSIRPQDLLVDDIVEYLREDESGAKVPAEGRVSGLDLDKEIVLMMPPEIEQEPWEVPFLNLRRLKAREGEPIIPNPTPILPEDRPEPEPEEGEEDVTT